MVIYKSITYKVKARFGKYFIDDVIIVSGTDTVIDVDNTRMLLATLKTLGFIDEVMHEVQPT
jgi:hypothetical protein